MMRRRATRRRWNRRRGRKGCEVEEEEEEEAEEEFNEDEEKEDWQRESVYAVARLRICFSDSLGPRQGCSLAYLEVVSRIPERSYGWNALGIGWVTDQMSY